MLIPHDLLEADTLNNLLEDFVTREGTDNGDETPLDVRVERARHALRRGEAVILFDPESQQCQLMLRSEVPAELLRVGGWFFWRGGAGGVGWLEARRGAGLGVFDRLAYTNRRMVWIARFQPDSEYLLALDRAGMRSQ